MTENAEIQIDDYGFLMGPKMLVEFADGRFVARVVLCENETANQICRIFEIDHLPSAELLKDYNELRLGFLTYRMKIIAEHTENLLNKIADPESEVGAGYWERLVEARGLHEKQRELRRGQG